MNLKERGITVGDLLLTIIIITTVTILVKTFNKDKKTSLNLINRDEISHKVTLFKMIDECNFNI